MTPKHQVGLFWFNNDLRVADNHALEQASREVEQLICIYCLPPSANGKKGPSSPSGHRLQFLKESLIDLNSSLNTLGQNIEVYFAPPLETIAQLITQYDIGALYSSSSADYYGNTVWQLLRQRYSMIAFNQVNSSSLFDPEQLPFSLNELPDSFSKFRRKVEPIEVRSPLATLASLPPRPSNATARQWQQQFPAFENNPAPLFKGGERSAADHLQGYFARGLASTYKETRNGLDGMDYSTKFSPWLANGNLSPRTIMQALREYEQSVEKNDSTYWIYFELLWRDYFRCYAQKYGKRLFTLGGINQRKPATSFYPERYQKWCQGNTPYPIINACMKQLNTTGYISNRGRQLVASCFVHELNLDWRYGAGYLEQQLIDYDVASNWGNWQYLAGVGADPRGHRQFNLAKQTQTYDPDELFINKWAGNDCSPVLDSVDAADWPILDSTKAPKI